MLLGSGPDTSNGLFAPRYRVVNSGMSNEVQFCVLFLLLVLIEWLLRYLVNIDLICQILDS